MDYSKLKDSKETPSTAGPFLDPRPGRGVEQPAVFSPLTLPAFRDESYVSPTLHKYLAGASTGSLFHDLGFDFYRHSSLDGIFICV